MVTMGLFTLCSSCVCICRLSNRNPLCNNDGSNWKGLNSGLAVFQPAEAEEEFGLVLDLLAGFLVVVVDIKKGRLLGDAEDFLVLK